LTARLQEATQKTSQMKASVANSSEVVSGERKT
jgi:hypothetical protein